MYLYVLFVLCVCYSYYGEYYESMKVKKSMKAKLEKKVVLLKYY